MSPSSHPVVIQIEDYGSLLRLPWFAVADTGTSTLDLFEGILTRQ